MSMTKATLAVLAIAAAIANGTALARGGGGGGHGGGGHSGGGHFGGHSGSAVSGAHVSGMPGRAPMASFSGAHFNSRVPAARPFVNRRLVVAAPLLVAPYYPYSSPYYGYSPGYSPGYDAPYDYPYDEPPTYGPDPGYGAPPSSYGPPPPPSSPQRSAQSAAPVAPTPIYYCAESRTYTNVIRDLECPGGWRKVM